MIIDKNQKIPKKKFMTKGEVSSTPGQVVRSASVFGIKRLKSKREKPQNPSKESDDENILENF
jgi:hypothetical protein